MARPARIVRQLPLSEPDPAPMYAAGRAVPKAEVVGVPAPLALVSSNVLVAPEVAPVAAASPAEAEAPPAAPCVARPATPPSAARPRAFPAPDKSLLIRELKELAASRQPHEGQLMLQKLTRTARHPVEEPAAAPQPDMLALVRELEELARHGAERDVERVRQEVADHMARFRDRPDDMPI